MSSEVDPEAGDRPGQFECTEIVLEATPDAAVIANLGVASYVLAGVEDRARNFYLWGSMGVTTPVGLGLALSIDDQVTVLDGDGSMLMSLGALATVAECDPSNLTIVVWDNNEYVTTGGQPTLSAPEDFASVARECGLDARHAATVEEFQDSYADAVAHDGASFVVCEVEPIDPPDRPPQDFAYIKRRFRDTLVGDGE